MKRSVVMLGILFALSAWSPAWSAPVEVRFPEGITHGFLLLRSATGQIVAQGDLLQTPHADRVETRMAFRFKDGSLYDEKVIFSQQRVFTLLSYSLVQRGPAFPEPTDVSFDRKLGSYQVTSIHKGREKTSSGPIDLPPDVYNGMTSMILKNLPPKRTESVHFVAFSPSPRIIRLDLVPEGDQRIRIGEQEGSGVRYAIKPKLGTFMGFVAKVLGKTPPDFECVIWTRDVPAFVRCDAPLRLDGPVYRIELAAPR
jgi:hypothetical protein